MDGDDKRDLQAEGRKSSPKVGGKKVRVNNLEASSFEVSPKSPDDGNIITVFFLDQCYRDTHCSEVFDKFSFCRNEAYGIFCLCRIKLSGKS